MRIFIFILFLLYFSSAKAEWTLISTNEMAEIYIDKENITKFESRRKFWQLINLNKNLPDGTLSVKGYIEIDCKDKRTRTLQEDYYTQLSAKGISTYTSDGSSNWRYMSPESSGATIFHLLCKK